jgi:hypothetical protein
MSDIKKIELSQHPLIIKQYVDDKLSMQKIADQYNVRQTSISRILEKNGIPRRSNKINSKKYDLDEDYFEVIDTEDKAYWLGFIYADGYISKNSDGRYSFGVSLAAIDKDHLEKLRNSLSSNHVIYDYTSNLGFSGNCSYSRLLIWNAKLVEDLKNHGVVEHKSNILTPPNLLENLIPHFIRGYIDGDGSISLSKGCYRLRVLGTTEILDYIKSYIEENSRCKIHKYFKRHEQDVVSNIDIGGNFQTLEVLDLFYKDAKIYLERKYNRYLDLDNKSRRA